jgi:hypothetical protein
MPKFVRDIIQGNAIPHLITYHEEPSPNRAVAVSSENPLPTRSAPGSETIISQVTGNISINNSTTDVLGAGGVFTGVADEVTNYKSIGINVIASHASAVDGMQFQFSSDGVNWDKIHYFSIPAAEAKFFNIPVESRYFRVIYTNGGILQTYFRLQVIFHATMTKESTLRIDDDIDGETAAQLNRTVMTGKVNSIYRNVTLDATTGVLPMISFEHHEVHEGDRYSYVEVADLALNNVADIQITTPDTTRWGHMTLQFSTESETEWWIWENVTINVPGTAVAEINRNRNSANVATVALALITNTSLANANADTSIVGATLLSHGISGAGKNAGSLAQADEYVLKQNTKYSIRFLAKTAGYVSWSMSWYEHANIL